MNLLLINSGDQNAFAALYNSSELHISYSSEFKDSSAVKQPDNLINCLQLLAEKYKDDFARIEAVAVTIGPGSFTGIRVGLAIAKGVAAARSIPLIPVSNFELTHSRIQPLESPTKFCILIPAKLPEYYYSIWSEGKEIKKGCIEMDNLSSILDENTTIVADFDNETKGKHSYFAYINSGNLESEPETMLKLAKQKFAGRNVNDPAEIEPLYMKDFVIKKQK